MNPMVFSVLSEPTRLQIVGALKRQDLAVGELVDELGLTQPRVSKHLKVLRDAGLVCCRIAAQRRIYQLNSQPLQQIDDWLKPFRQLWETHLDGLETFLDNEADQAAGEQILGQGEQS